MTLTRHRRALRSIVAAAVLSVVTLALPTSAAADSGTATGLPSGVTYGGQGQDITASDTYNFARNDGVQANFLTRTAGNNQQGAFVSGWPVDIYPLTGTVKETLDWTEGVIAPAPSAEFNFPGKTVPLTSLNSDGTAVNGSGAWQGGPVSAATRIEPLENAPVIKIALTLTNTSTSPTTGSFGYLQDPDDARAQTSFVPGVGRNPGLVSSGFAENFIYQGPETTGVDSPAHGLAWLGTTPEAVLGNNIYSGLWFDADLDAGASKTIVLYHIVSRAAEGDDPTANVRALASQLSTLDPGAVGDRQTVNGRVGSTDGSGVSGATVTARNIDRTRIVEATTGADGTYSMLLEPDTYTLTAAKIGFTNGAQSLKVERDGPYQVDIEVNPVRAAAGTGRTLPGALSEAGDDGVVLENQRLAMAVATSFEDPQLTPSTRGKPVDIAATGLNDGMDWINLPYLTRTRPATSEPWRQTQIRTSDVTIDEPGPERAVVTSTGTWSEDEAVTSRTNYVVEPDQPWVTATTTFTNAGSTDVVGFAGDAIDVDDGTTVSHVPGTGDITVGGATPMTYQPTDPWIAQFGAQPQTFGLVYTDGFAFEAVGNASYLVTVGEVTIPAGQSLTFARRIVADRTEGASDRAAPVREVYEQLLAERTGLTAELVLDRNVARPGETINASVVVRNGGNAEADPAAVRLDPGGLEALDPIEREVSGLAPGEERSLSFRLRPRAGGPAVVTATLTQGAQQLARRSVRVFVNGPGWFPGDNHTHSTFSDGSGTIAQNMAAGRAAGLSFVTATDHNTVNQRTALGPEQRPDFVAMYGDEVSAGYGHSLAYNIDSVIDASLPPQQMLDSVNANNGGKGFLYLAHPYYPGLEWDDFEGIDGLRGIEVWNGFYPPKHPVNAKAMAKWDELNRDGRHLFGLANSDAHNPGKVGTPRVKAWLASLTSSEIIKALGTGGLYGTDGVDVRFTVNGVRMGGDVGVPADGAPVTVAMGADFGGGVTAARLLVDGTVVRSFTPGAATFDEVVSLDLKPGQFVRFEADGAGGRFAFTNPVFAAATDVTPNVPRLAPPVVATTDEVVLEWSPVAGSDGYVVERAGPVTGPMPVLTDNTGWTFRDGTYSADPAPASTATVRFTTAGASALRFDENLDTEPSFDPATVTAVLADGSRVELLRRTGRADGPRPRVIELPAGTGQVEFALTGDGGDAGRDYTGWSISGLTVGQLTFSEAARTSDTTARLTDVPSGDASFRVRALSGSSPGAPSNIETAKVTDGGPAPVIPEVSYPVLLMVVVIGGVASYLARRRPHRVA